MVALTATFTKSICCTLDFSRIDLIDHRIDLIGPRTDSIHPCIDRVVGNAFHKRALLCDIDLDRRRIGVVST